MFQCTLIIQGPKYACERFSANYDYEEFFKIPIKAPSLDSPGIPQAFSLKTYYN